MVRSTAITILRNHPYPGEDIYFSKDCLVHKNIQNATIYSKFSTGTRTREVMRV